jgi:hypothetical protein
VPFYKSKGMREKDTADFDTMLPYLPVDERDWLRRALVAASPDHEWIERL